MSQLTAPFLDSIVVCDNKLHKINTLSKMYFEVYLFIIKIKQICAVSGEKSLPHNDFFLQIIKFRRAAIYGGKFFS